jgi:peptidoglycan hydrolase-like protein with peptidoglycan-binding domain
VQHGFYIRIETVLARSLGTVKIPQPETPKTTASAQKSTSYTLKQFIKDVQAATGAAVDGIAGKETLSKTVTVSARINRRHAVVKAIQKRLNSLGFNCGVVDGIAGAKFTAAVIAYQKSKNCITDGEITARHRTWQHLLEII